MQLIVDEQAYTGPLSASQTIQELADDVCGKGQNGRLVIGLACNGQAVTADQLETVLGSQINAFQCVEIQTVSVREQIRTTLAQAADTLNQAHAVRETAADLLDQGRHEPAMAELRQILEILKQVQQTALLTSQLLEIDLETLNPGGRNFLEVLSLVKNQLGQLKGGMEAHDFVSVSDILRYEFAEPLDAWASILGTLQDLADVP